MSVDILSIHIEFYRLLSVFSENCSSIEEFKLDSLTQKCSPKRAFELKERLDRKKYRQSKVSKGLKSGNINSFHRILFFFRNFSIFLGFNMADPGSSRYPSRGTSNQASKINSTESTVGPNSSLGEDSVKVIGTRDALVTEFHQADFDGKSLNDYIVIS